MFFFLIQCFIAILLVIGGMAALIGAIGTMRFNDFYMRMHGPAMSSTVGLGSIIIASIIFYWYHLGTLRTPELVLLVLVIITTPISAHLLTMTAMHLKLPRQSNTKGGPFEINEKIDQD